MRFRSPSGYWEAFKEDWFATLIATLIAWPILLPISCIAVVMSRKH